MTSSTLVLTSKKLLLKDDCGDFHWMQNLTHLVGKFNLNILWSALPHPAQRVVEKLVGTFIENWMKVLNKPFSLSICFSFILLLAEKRTERDSINTTQCPNVVSGKKLFACVNLTSRSQSLSWIDKPKWKFFSLLTSSCEKSTRDLLKLLISIV